MVSEVEYKALWSRVEYFQIRNSFTTLRPFEKGLFKVDVPLLEAPECLKCTKPCLTGYWSYHFVCSEDCLQYMLLQGYNIALLRY